MSKAGRVFLIDDDERLLQALSRRFVFANYTAEVFANPNDFLNLEVCSGPGCIVVDLIMPGMNGLEFQKALQARYVSLPIIFLTGHADVLSACAAFRAGAVDFLTKPVSSAELINAVSKALEKQITTLKEEEKVRSVRALYNLLTPRERQVCSLISKGLLNKQIGYSLGAAEATVKKHRARVLEKLNVQSVAELVTLVELMKRNGQLALEENI